MQAARALNHLNGSLLELYKDSFRLLPSYLTELIIRDPTGHLHLEKGPEGVFRGVFVYPGVSQKAYTYCRPRIVLDGTFLKGKFPLVSTFFPKHLPKANSIRYLCSHSQLIPRGTHYPSPGRLFRANQSLPRAGFRSPNYRYSAHPGLDNLPPDRTTTRFLITYSWTSLVVIYRASSDIPSERP
jgi:hypothetical protein